MPITIRLVEDTVYSASVTPPHGKEIWHTAQPMTAKNLVAKLRELGCHTTDIADAFYATNPDWLAEVD